MEINILNAIKTFWDDKISRLGLVVVSSFALGFFILLAFALFLYGFLSDRSSAQLADYDRCLLKKMEHQETVILEFAKNYCKKFQ